MVSRIRDRSLRQSLASSHFGMPSERGQSPWEAWQLAETRDQVTEFTTCGDFTTRANGWDFEF